ncbi:DEAD-box ATP-dependent RNA helicase 35 [Diplonema papillatum]|nr:DEAD-box ATP-dependent RNA helicase 35 [Diplonema papillatum]WGM50028.1 Abstrakt [Diplonema papillatum]
MSDDEGDFYKQTDEEEDVFVPLRVRRAIAEQKRRKAEDAVTGQKRQREQAAAAETPAADDWTAGPLAKKSLLELNIEALAEAKRRAEAAGDGPPPDDDGRDEDKDIEDRLNGGKQLRSVFDLAHGISYTERMPSTWKPPEYIRNMPPEVAEFIRKKAGVAVEGNDPANPCLTFRDCKYPAQLIAAMAERGITKPTPIQQQGMPVVLSRRDLIGIAFTGSGKTLAFLLPMLAFNLQEELMMPLQGGEGPLAVVLAPSRELAMQHHDIYTEYASALVPLGLPELRSLPAIGGTTYKDSDNAMKKGAHACVATPGRLIHILEKKSITLNLCTYICLDEADRMVDLGFEEEVKSIYQHFKHQRQTVMFSATMPKKIQAFAMTSLVDPVVVNVNRAGAASMDVTQEVEYVLPENKLINLLECLQKTRPPALIFAESKSDVDYIHEYLLLKCVDAVSVHGGKDQEERNLAIKRFRGNDATVLVATDLASKGLDFKEIQHVINYDLPREIENYVHRIGRTGRNGKTGLSTTFINKSCPETALLDLKHLLIEAKQKVPPVLQSLHDPLAEAVQDGAQRGCANCGGLGHALSSCPKLREQANRSRKNAMGDSVGGEM